MVGWGGVGFIARVISPVSSRSISPMFVIEPSLMAELNVTNFLRLAVGGGYRIVTGVQLDGLTNADVSSYSLSLNLKFGSFNVRDVNCFLCYFFFLPARFKCYENVLFKNQYLCSLYSWRVSF